ncbi:pitrilysin family protein [Hyphomicrobium sp. NDB2Meth4]|uniref:M16 family metallopeptidase n=1 Tax=Hyphomicrobium sp. NDB2Meth4 TaxID=1892846 RepID=UPI000931EBDD|nr:pitrilysin family protein [Hyphomicrobium sp. NDB2Meth4]
MKIETIKSPGGIDAWLVEEHAVPMLALRFAFDGGSMQDPVGKEGTANFLAQMLLEGAGELTATAFQDRVKDLALRIGFRSGRDALFGNIEVLTESRAEAASLLRLALMEPRFDADAVARTRQRLKVGIARAAREPDKVAAAEWDAVAFAGHPYARPIVGTLASVDAVMADDMEFYRRRAFCKRTLKVTAVGDVTAEELGQLLDEVFGDLPDDTQLPVPGAVGVLPAGRRSIIEMDVPQSVAVFGMTALARKDPDYMASVVLNFIGGGGSFSSRLMEEVRVKRGLTYGVSTSIVPMRCASILKGSVATRNHLIGTSLEVIGAEFAKMAAGDIGEDEVAKAKSAIIGSYPLAFDASAKIANQLLGLRLDGFGPEYVANRNAMVAAVTLADVKRVAAELLRPENLIVTVVGKPSLGAEHVAPQASASAA